jgi:hypothetical protein
MILLIFLMAAGMIIRRALHSVDFKADWNSLIGDYGMFGPLFLQSGIILFINCFCV